MSSVPQPRWEAPEVVERPSGEGLRSVLRRVADFTSIRAAGWVCLVAGLVSLALGIRFGWDEFLVAGLLGVVIVAIALLFTIGHPKLNVFVELGQRSVVVDQRAGGKLHVRNASSRRHWGSRLDLPVGDAAVSFSLPVMAAEAVVSQEFRIGTQRRGLVLIGPANSVQGDPFALVGRQTRWTERLELYVHPKTVSLPGRQTGFVHDLEGHASNHLSSSDMNFHALRPYVAGDDRRHVHWRSTARAGQLMVRQFEESRMSRVVVALDTGRSSYLDGDEFELAVSSAASVALQTLYAESPLTLLTSRQELATVSPSKTLDGLSTVTQSTRGGFLDLVRSTMRRSPGASVAICFTGSSTTLAQLRQSCAQFDVDTRVIGIRLEVGSQLRVRNAGNVTVLQIGELGQLPKGMRKAME